MEITVRLDEPVWRMVGQKTLTVQLEGTSLTVADVIRELGNRYTGLDAELRGETDDFVPYSLFLNDESVRWSEIESKPVRDGDYVRVFLPISGG